MSAKEKARDYLDKNGWERDPQYPDGMGELESIFEAGFRAALEWVLLYATEISEKYKSQSFGLPLIPANTLKSKIEKELEK